MRFFFGRGGDAKENPPVSRADGWPPGTFILTPCLFGVLVYLGPWDRRLPTCLDFFVAVLGFTLALSDGLGLRGPALTEGAVAVEPAYASASISMSIAGCTSLVTWTIVDAGGESEKNS